MRVGIVDDNDAERYLIKKCIQECFLKKKAGCEIVEYSTGDELIRYLNDSGSVRIDLLFLDVEMPGMDGIEVKDSIIHMDKVFRIVFVTMHMDTVYRAFGYKVIDFLTKPVSALSIEKNIDVAAKELIQNTKIPIEELPETYLEDLEYIKSENNYVWVYLKDRKDGCLVTQKMKNVEEKLQDIPIVRVHKSYMVNFLEVLEIGKEIRLKSGKNIPLGRKYGQGVKECFMEFKKKQIKGRMR